MEVSAEAPQTIANSSQINAEPIQSQGKRLFNGEYARQMAQKSKEVREQRKREAEQAKAIVKELEANAIVQPTEAYRLKRLNRIRAQLELVDSAIELCIKAQSPDQNRLKGLVEAQARLADQEQKLSMRPLPGSHRPRSPRPPKDSHKVEPLE